MDIKVDVTTRRSNYPLPKPDPGKTLFYFLQDDSRFNCSPRPTIRYGVDGRWVGATQGNAFFNSPSSRANLTSAAVTGYR